MKVTLDLGDLGEIFEADYEGETFDETEFANIILDKFVEKIADNLKRTDTVSYYISCSVDKEVKEIIEKRSNDIIERVARSIINSISRKEAITELTPTKKDIDENEKYFKEFLRDLINEEIRNKFK